MPIGLPLSVLANRVYLNVTTWINPVGTRDGTICDYYEAGQGGALGRNCSDDATSVCVMQPKMA